MITYFLGELLCDGGFEDVGVDFGLFDVTGPTKKKTSLIRNRHHLAKKLDGTAPNFNIGEHVGVGSDQLGAFGAEKRLEFEDWYHSIRRRVPRIQHFQFILRLRLVIYQLFLRLKKKEFIGVVIFLFILAIFDGNGSDASASSESTIILGSF